MRPKNLAVGSRESVFDRRELGKALRGRPTVVRILEVQRLLLGLD